MKIILKSGTSPNRDFVCFGVWTHCGWNKWAGAQGFTSICGRVGIHSSVRRDRGSLLGILGLKIVYLTMCAVLGTNYLHLWKWRAKKRNTKQNLLLSIPGALVTPRQLDSFALCSKRAICEPSHQMSLMRELQIFRNEFSGKQNVPHPQYKANIH